MLHFNNTNTVSAIDAKLFENHSLDKESQSSEVTTSTSCTSSFIKFNLHLVERCNYSCRHCFAKFNCKKMLKLEHWKKIVDACHAEYPNCSFNIAGGEPLLVNYFNDLVKFCNSLCHRVSVISNGILMTYDWIRANGPYLDTIGLSIDSFDDENMIKLGRCTRSGKMLTLAKVRKIMLQVKEINPACKIKINTVVSDINKQENIATDIVMLPVSRWKIMKMMPFDNGTFNNFDIAISDKDYGDYVSRNLGIDLQDEEKSLMVKMSNGCHAVVESTLKGGYLMIDANGNLVDDTINSSYVPVINCMKEKISTGLAKLTLNRDLYMSRYFQNQKNVANL